MQTRRCRGSQLPLGSSIQRRRYREPRSASRPQERRGGQGRASLGHFRAGKLLPSRLGNSQGSDCCEAGRLPPFLYPLATRKVDDTRQPAWVSLTSSSRHGQPSRDLSLTPLSTVLRNGGKSWRYRYVGRMLAGPMLRFIILRGALS